MGVGGAEVQLQTLLDGLSKKNFDILLVSVGYLDLLSVSNQIGYKKIVFNQNMRAWLYVSRCFELIRTIWKFSPDVILGWMYVGNIFAAFAKCFSPTANIFLGIRASNMDNKRYRIQKIINKVLSFLAHGVIYNSNEGRIHHQSIGYNTKCSSVIPNSVDLKKYSQNRDKRLALRRSLGIEISQKVLFYPARVDPMKNHDLVIQVANLMPEIKFIFAGEGTENLKPLHNCIFLGRVDKLERLYNISDLTLCFSKFGEGFPNVITESLACKVPVLSNSVGDAAEILEDTGFVTTADDPKIISDEIRQLFRKDRVLAESASKGRLIVSSKYTKKRMVDSYCDVLCHPARR